MHSEQPVSNREFAKLVGQSEGAVRKAIARESIKAGIVIIEGKPKILPSVAAAEWGKVLISKNIPSTELPSVEDPTCSVSEISDANNDIIIDTGDEDIADPSSSEPEEAVEDAELRKKIPDGITKAEADRRLSVLKARKAQIELAELEGRVVDKQMVFKQLAEMGIVIRDTFMNIPSRHLDEIVAADSRNERMILFENAIANALKSLVSLDNPVFERD